MFLLNSNSFDDNFKNNLILIKQKINIIIKYFENLIFIFQQEKNKLCFSATNYFLKIIIFFICNYNKKLYKQRFSLKFLKYFYFKLK